MEARGRLLACIPVNVPYAPISALLPSISIKHPLNGKIGGATENVAGSNDLIQET
jgi:hypothetical protein